MGKFFSWILWTYYIYLRLVFYLRKLSTFINVSELYMREMSAQEI